MLFTEVEKINPSRLQEYEAVFLKAAGVIQEGGLVAFPTETVYGLGADALNPDAVRKIYEAKGRPSDNPMIIHVASKEEATRYVKNVPPAGELLMEAFWPGPLTLIFPKADIVPMETSGGLDTVAIRFPKHPVARWLIELSGRPIAAPSANSSGKPSPTKASHVFFDLKGKVELILDGGSCGFGIESTIVDVTGEIPCLLRPGSVTLEMLEEVLGRVLVDPVVLDAEAKGKPKAPGMKYIHYSPLAKVTLVLGAEKKVANKINSLIDSTKEKAGVLASDQTLSYYDSEKCLVLSLGDRDKPETLAANLFKMLRKFDFLGVNQVYAEGFSEKELGLAIMNRLKKAAGYDIINLD